jgi:hypothetical protein
MEVYASAQSTTIERLTNALEGFLALEDLIRYQDDTKEEHYGEAQAISNALSVAREALASIKK